MNSKNTAKKGKTKWPAYHLPRGRVNSGARLTLLVLIMSAGISPAAASPQVAILTGPQPAALERLAATELEAALERLFEVEVFVRDKPAGDEVALLLVGTPGTHPQIAEAVGQDAQLGEQEILLRHSGETPPTLVVSGGSAVAVLWSAYELVERIGVRYLLDRDVYPERRKWSGLPQLDVAMQPDLRVRCWRLINDLALGPVSWSLEENKRFVRQMAKLKFNRVHTYLWPPQPFVHYTFRGVPKPPGILYFGYRFPIDDDTIGRERFKGMTQFTNPEFVGAESPEEVHRRAVALVRGIHAEARRLGMQTVVSFEPFSWPKEFLKVIPNAQPSNQVGSRSIQPGEKQSLDDPLLHEMVLTVVRAYVETYPDVDFVQLSVPEHRAWRSQGREAYERLDERYDLSDLGTYDQLCARARSRTSYPGGGVRVENQVKGDLAILWLLDTVVREENLLRRPGGGEDLKLIYRGLSAELFPLVARIMPPGGEVVNFIDYTASRVLQHRELIRQSPTKDVPVSLILTLADDNVGVLPQLATSSIHQLLPELCDSGWAGFHTRYWTVGEQDPAIHFLARSSWDRSLTPDQSYTDQVRHVCGPESVKPALESFALLEKITLGLDQHALGFGFPVPSMMTRHYSSGGLTEPMQKEHKRYRQALNLMQQAHQRSRLEGQPYTGYLVGRLQFAVHYLDAVAAFGATGRAEKAGDTDVARNEIDKAYRSIRKALKSYVAVARDHGDLGAVALMNEYCYRPIRDKRAELQAGL